MTNWGGFDGNSRAMVAFWGGGGFFFFLFLVVGRRSHGYLASGELGKVR